jgi:parallel beta-helix repeat protein
MMTAAWRAGCATDCGPARSRNEDRIYVDEARGIFLVVDGVGGQAAGEKAAETAVDVIVREMAQAVRPDESGIRHAIASANNEILALAATREEWQGMACVLTLAAIDGDSVVVGHVGDSRLYLAWNGNLRKITSDHSPVGEREDTGELTEQEAMHHPGRNQIYREVGAVLHSPDDAGFIETHRVPFRADAALVLCSDGLSDVRTSADISAIVEKYDGDPEHVAHELVDSAIAAGSRDNVSAIFVPGPDFAGSATTAPSPARTRLAATRVRGKGSRGVFAIFAWIVFGAVIGAAAGGYAAWTWLVPPALSNAPPQPRHLVADIDAYGITRAMRSARAGDTIEVPPGEFLGPVVLRDDVTLIARNPGDSVIHADPQAPGDAGIAVVARAVHSARISGFRIAGTNEKPLVTGVLLENSGVTVDDMEISGATDAGVHISGASTSLIEASRIHSNMGSGIKVAAGSASRITGNRIYGNGAAGIELSEPRGAAVIESNIVNGNGRDDADLEKTQ